MPSLHLTSFRFVPVMRAMGALLLLSPFGCGSKPSAAAPEDAGAPSSTPQDAAVTGPEGGPAVADSGPASPDGGPGTAASCNMGSGQWNAGTNRIPGSCYAYPLTNSMWANRVPIDAMDHLWNSQEAGLPNSADYYARNAMTARGAAPVNCSTLAAIQGGAQPSGCNDLAGGHVFVASPAIDGSRSNRESSPALWYAVATDPVFSVGGPGNGTTCQNNGPFETKNVCAVFHAPAGAQHAWFGGGSCFNGTTAGAAGDPNPMVPLCEYDSQCNPSYSHCLASSSRTTYQPSYDDSFLWVFDQTQQLMIESQGGAGGMDGLTLPSCTQGNCASVCSGHAGSAADPCPLPAFSYLAAESVAQDSDWNVGSHTVVVNGIPEYLGASGDNGAGMSAGGAVRTRLEEFQTGIFHVTQGASTGNTAVPTIWPGMVAEVSGMSPDGMPGGAWVFLDYTDEQVEQMGLDPYQKVLVTQLAHYGTILENWADDSFTQFSESSEGGMAYFAATGHQHPLYEWINGQKIGVASTGFQYTINCHNNATLGDSQYFCETDSLYGLPMLPGPGTTDASGQSCQSGCDVSGHLHVLDPSALAGYIGPNQRAGEPTPTAGLVVVSIVGTGAGVILSDPPGMNCDHVVQCNVAAALGKGLVLTAQATSASFRGWSGGGCSGTGTCAVTIGPSPVLITATFQ